MQRLVFKGNYTSLNIVLTDVFYTTSLQHFTQCTFKSRTTKTTTVSTPFLCLGQNLSSILYHRLESKHTLVLDLTLSLVKPNDVM